MTAGPAPRPLGAATDPHSRATHRTAVARLALGGEVDGDWPAGGWRAVFESARYERCASLAWLRSRATIRDRAPASVSGAWRAETLAAGELAAAQIGELAQLITTLESAAVTPVVMKGHPLAQLAYHDASVRPSFDIDIFVPLDQRKVAHIALLGSGWQHLEGEAPAEGTYRRTGHSRSPHLEVHSSLMDDALIAHLPTLEPERARISVGGHEIPAHVGDTLPVFLATHLAKHGGAPLLWWLDFATVWGSLDPEGRGRARKLAKERGLAGFLGWAELGASLVGEIVDGSQCEATAALARLDSMHAGRNTFRVVRLVHGTATRARVIGGWLVPPQIRGSAPTLLRWTMRRIGRLVRSRRPPLRSRPHAPVPMPVRTLEVSPTLLASLVRDATSAGRSTWIKVRGTSMLPTIPRIAEVRVDPVPPAGLQRGDVALVDCPGAGLVMHRVLRIDNDTIHLKGDNRPQADPPVAREAVLGVAAELRTGGRSVVVRRLAIGSLRFYVARWRTLLARRALRA